MRQGRGRFCRIQLSSTALDSAWGFVFCWIQGHCGPTEDERGPASCLPDPEGHVCGPAHCRDTSRGQFCDSSASHGSPRSQRSGLCLGLYVSSCEGLSLIAFVPLPPLSALLCISVIGITWGEDFMWQKYGANPVSIQCLLRIVFVSYKYLGRHSFGK